jgi:nitroimidazol reductase NimA-like FMN-containing flavoprotein (pyridoxamine 5'-phosphate oxidase superfamily)
MRILAVEHEPGAADHAVDALRAEGHEILRWDDGPGRLGPLALLAAWSRSDDGDMEVDRNGLEVLGPEECLRLLRTAAIGRVGLSSAALPSVLPVNFRLVGDRILFRTGWGSKLDAATRNAVVAFEVDDFDVVDHTGWSVLVVGVARDLLEDEVDEIDPAERARIERWASGPDDRMVAISCELVSGRRIVPGLITEDRLPANEEVTA